MEVSMQLITHQHHLDTLPESPLKVHIQKRFDQLFETEYDLLPNIILVEVSDEITGPDYAFVGPSGLQSCFCPKWTRKWTCVLDVWIRLSTGEYTLLKINLPKTAF